MSFSCALLLVVIAVSMCGAAAFAAENVKTAGAAGSASQHFCTPADLMNGTWRLVSMGEKPEGREMAWYNSAPYQYITFYTGNLYSYLAADREIKQDTEVQRKLLETRSGKHLLRWALDNKGVLNLYFDKVLNYSYRCIAVLTPVQGYQEGDLVLTGYTHEKTELFKWYRRLF